MSTCIFLFKQVNVKKEDLNFNDRILFKRKKIFPLEMRRFHPVIFH